jgi:hypothetical protein
MSTKWEEAEFTRLMGYDLTQPEKLDSNDKITRLLDVLSQWPFTQLSPINHMVSFI